MKLFLRNLDIKAFTENSRLMERAPMVDTVQVVARYLKGVRKTAVFAVTTRCNCRCAMCDIYKGPSNFIRLEDSLKVLDFLSRNKFLIVYFTGGEPTLHPDIIEMVRYANSLGLLTAMTTNGTAPRNTTIKLKESGLFLLSVSFDHWDASLCEKIRRHNNIKFKQEDTIKSCKEIGLKTHTLTFLNSYVVRDGVEKIVRYVNQRLGVPSGFCYPIKSNSHAYPIGAELSEEHLSFQNLKGSIEKILLLKRRGALIANLGTYLEDILNFHNGKTPNFYCKGGKDVLYIDWSGNVYPCFMKKKMFNILQDEETRFFKETSCNGCLTNCFREPSILAQSPFLIPLIKEIPYAYSTRKLFI